MKTISYLLLIITICACTKYNEQDFCGEWYYKTTLFQLQPEGTLAIKNLDESFFDLNEQHGYPLNSHGSWSLKDDRIYFISDYGFELFIPLSYEKPKQLWFFIGDPDEMNVIEILKLSNNLYMTERKDIVIPQNINSIEHSAFTYNKGLRSVVIPQNIDSICYGAFWMCSNLEKIVLHDGIKKIDDGAFADCSKLKEIKIPSSVNAIGYFVLSGCKSLEKIVVDKNNVKYDSRNDCNAIIRSEDNRLVSGCKKTVIPNSVKSIEKYAFRDCIGLDEITIPCGVDSIFYYAFSGCVGLKNIYISNSVRYIAPYAFSDCKELRELILPEGIVSINCGTFAGCSSLKKIYIPGSLKVIGERAFYGCKKLEEIVIPKGTSQRFKELFPEELHSLLKENNRSQ